MFRGTRPSAQPRTLRSIAEDKGTTPNGFVDGGVEPGSGLPIGMPGAAQTYVGMPPMVEAAPRTPAGDPSPFKSLRRGR